MGSPCDKHEKCKECIICVEREEGFEIYEVFQFPVKIPEGYMFLMLEKKQNGTSEQIYPIKKDDEFYVKAADFNNDSEYFIHLKCPPGIVFHHKEIKVHA